MPTMRSWKAVIGWVAFVGSGLAGVPTASGEVIAVAAADSYADLKKQVRWVGGLVGNPALDGVVESLIMVATQSKGLAGLDVGRPLGLVVTLQDGQPAIHGFVPVKDVGKLLDAAAGVVGPAEERDGGWRLAAPGGMGLAVVEKGGWAVVSAEDSKPADVDPEALFAPIVKSFSLGVRVFPSLVPDELLQVFAAQAAAASAGAVGGSPDPAAVARSLAQLKQTESLLIGISLDEERNRAYVETRMVAVPESPAAAVWTGAGRAALTIPSPPAADGKPLAIRAHAAQAVAADARAAVEATLAAAVDNVAADQSTAFLRGLLGDLAAAMLDTGALDMSVAIDTAVVTDDAPIPAVTLGMRVKDGAALEAKIKERLGAPDALPAGVKLSFDAGTSDGMKLHEGTVPGPGGAAPFTLATGPERVFVMIGPGASERLAALVKAAPAAGLKPFIGVDVALGPWLAYVARMQAQLEPQAADPALVAAAAAAKAEDSAALQLLVRPLERGVAARLTADAGAIRSLATLATVIQAAAAAGFGGGAGGGPIGAPAAGPPGG